MPLRCLLSTLLSPQRSPTTGESGRKDDVPPGEQALPESICCLRTTSHGERHNIVAHQMKRLIYKHYDPGAEQLSPSSSRPACPAPRAFLRSPALQTPRARSPRCGGAPKARGRVSAAAQAAAAEQPCQALSHTRRAAVAGAQQLGSAAKRTVQACRKAGTAAAVRQKAFLPPLPRAYRSEY